MSERIRTMGTVVQFPKQDAMPEVMRRIRSEIRRLPDCQAKKDMEKAWSKAVLSLASHYPADF